MGKSQFNIDNSGIGGTPFLTFSVDISPNKDFTQSDLDNNLIACVISGNNEVGMGAAGNKLFGKVNWVSQEQVSGTTIPTLCAVQARGVVRFEYETATKSNMDCIPRLNRMVEIAGGGKVRRALQLRHLVSGHLMRGQVIAVDEINKTCDVWLG